MRTSTLRTIRPHSPDYKEKLTWWDDVTKTLERHTVLLCVIVLLIQTIKLITTVVMLSTALLREGVAGLLAVTCSYNAVNVPCTAPTKENQEARPEK